MIIGDHNHNPKVLVSVNTDLFLLECGCPYFNRSEIDPMSSLSTLTSSHARYRQSLAYQSLTPTPRTPLKLCIIGKKSLFLFPPFATIDMSLHQHIVSPIPDPQSTTSLHATRPSTPTLVINSTPYHPSADIDLEDDSDEDDVMQPPARERVKVTKAASATSKITTQLNRAKCKKFDTSMVELREAIEKLVSTVAVKHSYKNQYVTKLLNHTMNFKTSRLPNLENAKVHAKTVELNTGK